MDYKVHWIIDGIMNVDANSKEDAEKIVQEKLQNFVKNSDDLMNFFIAKSIQGQAYLPGTEENENFKKEDNNSSDLKNESNQNDT